jgi:hypothetical protein
MGFVLHFQNCTNDAPQKICVKYAHSTLKKQDNLRLQFSLDVLVVIFSGVHLHESATQPLTAVIQSDVDEDDTTITDANKTYQMHREFFGRRVSSPSMRDDEHCDAHMARGSFTSASFWVSIFHPPGLQKQETL